MKKILGLLTIVVCALVVFGVVSKRAEANQAIFAAGGVNELENAKQISLGILRDRGAENNNGLAVKKVQIDELNMAHARVQQQIGGIPVWGGEAIVHLRPNGHISSVTDAFIEGVLVNTTPKLSEKQAISIARRMYPGSAYLTAEPITDLWIYRAKDRDHLTYRVRMRREDGSKYMAMPVLFVDAHTGEKVFEYDNLQAATASSQYSGTVNIGTSSAGGTFYMENLTRRIGTFTYNNTTTTVARLTDDDDVWDSRLQEAGVDAQYGAEKTFEYFQTAHSRNGIDGSGGPALTDAATNDSIMLFTSRVHYSNNYSNAFWNGTYMTYGDGDGVNVGPLTTLDICGHEMTHGITERTAGLIYIGESGALNESISDIFGAMIESFARGGAIDGDTWKYGEQALTPAVPGDSLRRMDDPNANGHPDHYSLKVSTPDDSYNVHTNSSIASHAFYLAAAGGTNRVSAVTVTGIGTTNAARIWYRALTTYMTATTNFAGARTATLNAAADLFGTASEQYSAVSTAWCAVGVGTCSTPSPTPTGSPTPSPTPTIEQSIQNLRDTIGSLELPQRVETGLRQPLASINPSNIPATCGKMRAFTNEVNARLLNGQVTEPQGSQLLPRASSIRGQLGCN